MGFWGIMRFIPITAAAAAAIFALATLPADAQSRRAGVANEAYPGQRTMQRTRITVRPRSFLDAGTVVLPLSQPYLDYVNPPLSSPYRIWDTTGSFRSPLPGRQPYSGWLP